MSKWILCHHVRSLLFKQQYSFKLKTVNYMLCFSQSCSWHPIKTTITLALCIEIPKSSIWNMIHETFKCECNLQTMGIIHMFEYLLKLRWPRIPGLITSVSFCIKRLVWPRQLYWDSKEEKIWIEKMKLKLGQSRFLLYIWKRSYTSWMNAKIFSVTTAILIRFLMHFAVMSQWNWLLSESF